MWRGQDDHWMGRWRVSPLDRAKRLVAKNVRKRRMSLGLTQEALAERAEIDTRHLQKIEAAELNLTLATLSALARAIRLPLRDLFL